MRSFLAALLCMLLLAPAARAQTVNLNLLSPANTPLSGAETLWIVQNGQPVRATTSQLAGVQQTLNIVGGTINSTTIGNLSPAGASFSALAVSGQEFFGFTGEQGGLQRLQVNGSAFINGSLQVGVSSPSLNVLLDVQQLTGGAAITGRILNGSTNAGTVAQFQAATGSLNAFANFAQVDGVSPSFNITTGSGDVAGITIDASAAAGASLALKANSGAVTFSTLGGLQAQVTNTAVASNAVSLSGSATAGAPSITTVGTDTNPPLLIKPKGTGQVIHGNPVADQAYDFQTPVTGFSITMAAGRSREVLDPAGALASGTIVMPATAGVVDGQFACVSSSQTVTALAVNANTSQLIKNQPSTMAAGTAFCMMWRAANTTWYRVQ